MHAMPNDNTNEVATLSFLEAFEEWQHERISWEAYIRHLTARLRGITYEVDNDHGVYLKLLETDPFGCCIWRWSNRADDVVEGMALNYSSVNCMLRAHIDTVPIEKVFSAYRRGLLHDVRARLALLDKEQAANVIKSLDIFIIAGEASGQS